MAVEMTPEEAEAAIMHGDAPAGITVQGDLSFFNGKQPFRLPDDLTVDGLFIFHGERLRTLPQGLHCKNLWIWDSPITTLPADLQITGELALRQCTHLGSLPAGLRLYSLDLRDSSSLTHLPDDISISGTLDVGGCTQLQELPAGISIHSLTISGCTQFTELPSTINVDVTLNLSGCTNLESLPDNLRVAVTLDLSDCIRLKALPAGLSLRTLILRNCTSLTRLPDDLRVTEWLDANGCTSLESLPTDLSLYTLNLAGCTALRSLPEGLRPLCVYLTNCTALTEWQDDDAFALRRLIAGGCTRLTKLPAGLYRAGQVDVSDCASLRELPPALRVTEWLDIGNAPLRALPPSRRGFQLRWLGVPINGLAALHPETITAQQVLKQSNAEVRRVMLDRMGVERFMTEAQAEVLDEDADAGGQRRLLRVPIPNDEALVCLSVRDPSTGRHYLIRVPPAMQSCHQSAAWIAGYDNPDDYHPIAET